MTDQQRQLALKALEEFRAGLNALADPFKPPAYVLAPAEPVSEVLGCYVYRLTPPTDGLLGFVLDGAVYPLYRATYKHDLARTMAIVRAWRWVHKEVA